MARRGSPRSRAAGRDLAGLLGDFGHQVPYQAIPPGQEKEPRLFHGRSWRGQRQPERGWASAKAPVASWRMSSDQAGLFWPFIPAPTLPPTGAHIGMDIQNGATFYADPHGWVTHDDLPVTNPNVIVLGKPGQGKSATTKCFLLRMLAFGYRVLVLGDPKDEYEPLCRALGVEPLRIGVGLPARINPLDTGPLGQGWAGLSRKETIERASTIFARWQVLLRGLVASQRLGEAPVPFGPSQARVISTALQALTGYTTGTSQLAPVTIPQLWHALDAPSDQLVQACRYPTRQAFWDGTRLLRDALDQLVTGPLAGLFDDHTNIDIDWRAPIQSLSIQALEPLGDEAVGIALTALNSWGRGMREIAEAGDRRVVVRDECWRQMRLGTQAVRSFDADLRLSRNTGDIQWAIAHKPSDWLSAGDAGSQAVAIAKDMLHLCDIRILHGQDAHVSHELDQLLDLGDIARDMVTGWARQGRGRALWCLGPLTYRVQTIRHTLEEDLSNTNEAIT